MPWNEFHNNGVDYVKPDWIYFSRTAVNISFCDQLSMFIVSESTTPEK